MMMIFCPIPNCNIQYFLILKIILGQECEVRLDPDSKKFVVCISCKDDMVIADDIYACVQKNPVLDPSCNFFHFKPNRP